MAVGKSRYMPVFALRIIGSWRRTDKWYHAGEVITGGTALTEDRNRAKALLRILPTMSWFDAGDVPDVIATKMALRLRR